MTSSREKPKRFILFRICSTRCEHHVLDDKENGYLSSSTKEAKVHHELLKELDAKIQRFKKDPGKIGGHLSGALHGKKSTRLTKNFRLVFEVDENDKTVYLVALDHRGRVYEN